MKAKFLTLTLVVSILSSAVIGAVSIYLLNEIIQIANRTTYSLEEEISLFDQVIVKAKNNEINKSELVRLIESQKKTRISSYDLMDSVQGITYSVITTLFFIVILQLNLLYSYMKRKDGN